MTLAPLDMPPCAGTVAANRMEKEPEDVSP